jgi:hypothetical protein
MRPVGGSGRDDTPAAVTRERRACAGRSIAVARRAIAGDAGGGICDGLGAATPGAATLAVGAAALAVGAVSIASATTVVLSPAAPPALSAGLRWMRLRAALLAMGASAARPAPPSATGRATPRANPLGASRPCPWVSGASAMGAGAAPARSARNGGVGAISGGAPTVVPSTGRSRHACGPLCGAPKTSPPAGEPMGGCGLLNGQGKRM